MWRKWESARNEDTDSSLWHRDSRRGNNNGILQVETVEAAAEEGRVGNIRRLRRQSTRIGETLGLMGYSGSDADNEWMYWMYTIIVDFQLPISILIKEEVWLFFRSERGLMRSWNWWDIREVILIECTACEWSTSSILPITKCVTRLW